MAETDENIALSRLDRFMKWVPGAIAVTSFALGFAFFRESTIAAIVCFSVTVALGLHIILPRLAQTIKNPFTGLVNISALKHTPDELALRNSPSLQAERQMLPLDLNNDGDTSYDILALDGEYPVDYDDTASEIGDDLLATVTRQAPSENDRRTSPTPG